MPKSKQQCDKLAVGYIRVSRMKDDEADSPKQQQEAIELMCKMKGWNLVKVYQDLDISGKDMVRPQLQQMLNDARMSAFNVCVFYKMSRLARKRRDMDTIMSQLQEKGVDLKSCTEDWFDTASNGGRLITSIMASIYEWERENTAAIVKDNMYSRAGRGDFCGGTVPFGYFASSKKLYIDADKAPHVKRIFDLYASGKYGFISLNTLLNEEGVPSPGKSKWNVTKLRYLLNNPIYAGLMAYGRIPVSNNRRITAKSLWQVVKGNHEAIIDQELFDTVQKLLQARKDKTDSLKGGNPRKYLLTGLGILRCGRCDSPMVSSTAKGRHGNVFVYYRCKSSFEGEKCGIGNIRQDILESFLLSRLQRIRKFPSEAIEAISEHNKKVKESRNSLEEQMNGIEQRFHEIESTKKKLLELALSGQFEPEIIDEKRKEMEAETKTLTKRKWEITNLLNAYIPDKLSASERMQDLLEPLDNWDSMNFQERQGWLKTYIDQIIVDKKDSLRVRLRLPLSNDGHSKGFVDIEEWWSRDTPIPKQIASLYKAQEYIVIEI